MAVTRRFRPHPANGAVPPDFCCLVPGGIFPFSVLARCPMFDVGFSELLVIGVVALIVVGPERMPAFARTAGHLLGRAQRYVTQIKADIDREVNFKDVERVQESMAATARQWEDTVRREYEAARNAVAAPAVAAQAAVAELRAESAAVTITPATHPG